MSILCCGPYVKRIQWLSGLALLLSVGLSLGQNPSDVSLDELSKEDRKHRELLKKLKTGEVQANANDKTHVEAADFHARYLTYRFAHPSFHKVGSKDIRDSMEGLYRDFESDVDQILGKNKDKTKDYA